MSKVPDYLGMFVAKETDRLDYGVKGMKWGQRKAERKAAKADKKFEKSFVGIKGFVKVNNTIAEEVNSRVGALNSKPAYAGKDLTKDKALHAKYWKDVDKLLDDSFAAASVKLGSNPSGTKKVEIKRVGTGEQATWSFSLSDMQHAQESDNVVLTPVVDDLGQLVKFEIKQEDLVHSASPRDYISMFVAKEEDDRLDYGIKGMKWGQRRSEAQLAAARKGSKETSDGPESSSQKYTRLLAKSKKEGANSLSDEELRFVTQRGDAIRKVNQLNEKKPGWLADATKTALKNAAKREMQTITTNVAKKYISDELFPPSGK